MIVLFIFTIVFWWWLTSNNTKNIIIPKQIFQTWHSKSLPPKMEACIQRVKVMNPDFQHFLFDDTECLEFIQKFFGPSVSAAYQSLKPGAYKADLWRYCVLYVHGGFYMDVKFRPQHSLGSLCHLSECFVKDLDGIGVYNAFIGVSARNPRMRKCIEDIVKNVRNKYYGKTALDPTGPRLLRKCFSAQEFRDLPLFMKNHICPKHGEQIEVKKGLFGKVILKSYSEYRKEQKAFASLEHYSVLWRSKNIYQ